MAQNLYGLRKRAILIKINIKASGFLFQYSPVIGTSIRPCFDFLTSVYKPTIEFL